MFSFSSKFFLLIIFFVSINHENKSQTFGFGCLGFVGGFGGYSYQQYMPEGLNNYINFFNANNGDSLNVPIGKFGKAKGYRLGLNFFRANFPGIIITSKGFYQSLMESNDGSIRTSTGIISTTSYELKMDTWGVGIDIGTKIFGGLSWKIIDAALMFNKAKLTNTRNFPGASTEVKEYKSDSKLGYSIGSGFILEIIDEYITLEGLAAYTMLSTHEIHLDDGTKLTLNEKSSEPMNNFIESGGFNVVVQLNVGFPL